MRKSQNVKVKDVGVTVGRIAGRISCLGLVGLGLLTINPACGNVHALTTEELTSGLLTSAVNISFAPTSGNTTLSPTNAAGASGLISVLANVGVTNSGGYSVYLGSSDTNLVGARNKDVTIPGVSGEVSFENLQDNTWGYTVAEGASIPESATYKAVSKGQGDTIFTNNNSRIGSENKTFALGFAAKIDNSLPADTYQNQVTLSVVSSPYQLTLMDIDEMQEMTSAVCENTPQLATKQLRDARDGKYYWVTKLADNRCWMTQNLDLDLSTNVALTPEDSDVTASWMPEYATATVVNAETILANDLGQRSWSLGDYRITRPTQSLDCGFKQSSVASCPEQFTPTSIPTVANNDEFAHYVLGNHYQWNAATAGTGGTITDGQATSSICPKGWRLPTSASGGEFQKLISAGGIGTDVAKFTSAPYYFVRGGVVYMNDNLFSYAGKLGLYWSSTPTSNTGTAYNLQFYDSRLINASYNLENRRNGNSVRCIAR
jgi:uncharacterized protein (TIGR02145 family)